MGRVLLPSERECQTRPEAISPAHHVFDGRRLGYRGHGERTRRPVLLKLQLPTTNFRTVPSSAPNLTLKQPVSWSRIFDSRPDADVDACGERASVRASRRWVTVPESTSASGITRL
jgi:hypothetical protein